MFAVALYRYAIDAPIGTFSPGDLENPFTGAKGGEKRKSWILRIGVPFLALFAVLCIVVAIFHPRRDGAEGYYRQADGYYRYSWYAQGAPDVGLGAPVEYQGRPIGKIVKVENEGTEIVTTIWVASRFRRLRRVSLRIYGRAGELQAPLHRDGA